MRRDLIVIDDLLDVHHPKEISLRRRQNAAAAAFACGHVALIDIGWSRREDRATATLRYGVIPVSNVTWSNWLVGSDRPFVLPDDGCVFSADDEARASWATFNVDFRGEGVSCDFPDDACGYAEWGEQIVSKNERFLLRACPNKRQARAWLAATVAEFLS